MQINLRTHERRTRLEEQSLSQKLIGNMVFNFLGQFYVLALSLAVVPYVVHRLGAGLYGVLILVATLGGFGSMFNLGMGATLGKYISEYYWQEQVERIRVLFQTGFAMALLGGALSFLLLIGFKNRLSGWLFHGDAAIDSYVSFALWITALALFLSPVAEVLSAIPTGLQRFDIFNRVNIFVATVRNLGMILALALGLYLRAVLTIFAFSSVANVLAYVYYVKRLVPSLPLRPRVDIACLKQLASYSAFMLLAGVSALVVHRADRVLVAYFLPIAAVSFYAVPYSLAEKTGLTASNITSVIFPSASELTAMQAHEKLQELYVRATKVVILVGLPVTMILLALPGPILQWWVGPDFASKGAATLRFLAAGFLLNIVGYVPFVVAQGVGRPWMSAKFSLLNGVVNLALFVILIPRLGIIGAGVGFFVSEALVIPLLVWEVNRALLVPWRFLILRSYTRPLACGVAGFGVLWVLRPYQGSLMRLVLFCGAGLAVYSILGLILAIDNRERTGVYHQLLGILGSRGSAANA